MNTATTRHSLIAAALLLGPLVAAGHAVAPSPVTASADTAAARFDASGQLQRPSDYRGWVYLSSGFDMSYNPALRMGHHMFDNVFVDPASYRSFLRTGTWPDKTMLVMEVRGAASQGSINKAGHYQAGGLMGLEVHLRDDTRFPGRWAFFAFGDRPAATVIPHGAECYACHADHGAVDSTFVQFYPTLLPIAEGRKTLSPTYLQMRAKLAGPQG